MFHVKYIDHLVLRVRDLEAMQHFYIAILGGTLERVREDLGLYQLRFGSSLLDLITVAGELGRLGGAAPGQEGRNLDHFCFQLDSFNAAEIMAYLCSKGCDPKPVANRYGANGYGPSIYVRDPEGNIVELKGDTLPEFAVD